MARKAVAKPVADPRDHHLILRGKTFWCVRIVSGKKLSTSLRTDDVAKARAERDRLIEEASDIRAGREPPAPAPAVIEHLWEHAVEGYLRYEEGKSKSGGALKTARRYEVSLIQISEALAGTKLSDITSDTVLDFVIARREDDKAASTIKNDLTAWGHVMKFANVRKWCADNPIASFDRKHWIGSDADNLNPPEDVAVNDLVESISTWSTDMADLVVWLRETGMRLSEALHIERRDVHPCGTFATLRRGVKRNKRGDRVRTIDLGRAAVMLPRMPKEGRLFAGLNIDSAVTSTRYGQWHRQRQGRENREAEASGRVPMQLLRFRLHDLRHSFAIASMLDDKQGIYRLQQHLGHSSISVTEGYLRFLDGEGAQRRYGRRKDLFGSLPPERLISALSKAA
jgi:integrase/recombinase XerD